MDSGESLADAAGALSASRRARDLDAVAGGTFDVVVVGAGVTGAGVALDAASRGLSVALLQRADLAAGTSRWSSKLVHVACAISRTARSAWPARAPGSAPS